ANQIIRRANFKQLPKSVVDNNKVTDHHAIIPTEEAVFLDDFTPQERRIYDLVIKRFLAILKEPHVYEQVTIFAEMENEKFTARGKVVKDLGWKEVYEKSDMDENDKDTEQRLPAVKKGESFPVNLKQTTGETKPSSRFTEGNLLQAMENPARYLQTGDKKLTSTLQETGGLGTVATRADIIEKLFRSMLMEQKGKQIHLTNKGKQLLELVPEELRS